jgi:hypothetical protein
MTKHSNKCSAGQRVNAHSEDDEGSNSDSSEEYPPFAANQAALAQRLLVGAEEKQREAKVNVNSNDDSDSEDEPLAEAPYANEELKRECVICSDVCADEWLRLECDHWFHDTCIRRALTFASKCPTCRRDVVMLGDEVIPEVIQRNAVENDPDQLENARIQGERSDSQLEREINQALEESRLRVEWHQDYDAIYVDAAVPPPSSPVSLQGVVIAVAANEDVMFIPETDEDEDEVKEPASIVEANADAQLPPPPPPPPPPPQPAVQPIPPHVGMGHVSVA